MPASPVAAKTRLSEKDATHASAAPIRPRVVTTPDAWQRAEASGISAAIEKLSPAGLDTIDTPTKATRMGPHWAMGDRLTQRGAGKQDDERGSGVADGRPDGKFEHRQGGGAERVRPAGRCRPHPPAPPGGVAVRRHICRRGRGIDMLGVVRPLCLFLRPIRRAAPKIASMPKPILPRAGEPPRSQADTAWRWFRRGVAAAFSLPALVLASSFVGFAALAIQAGLPLAQTLFMTAFVWALPAKVVLIGAIIAGNALPAAAFAVALSSVRLTPMVAALVPELRAPGTRKWVPYMLAHFVAVTSWVIAMERLGTVPRDMRTAYYGGLGATLVVLNLFVVAGVYVFASDLPPVAAAALFLLTPLYFLTSLWGSARERAGQVAMALGLVLWPLYDRITPEFSLLATGLTGGIAAWLWHRSRQRRVR